MTDLVDRDVSVPLPVKTPEEVVKHAILYMQEHGWARRTMLAEDGSVCALGALRCVIFGNNPEWQQRWNSGPKADLLRSTQTVLGKFIYQKYLRDDPTYSWDGATSASVVTFYNDLIAESMDDVVEAMRGSISETDH